MLFLPALLPREPLVQQCEDLGDVELNVLQIQIVLAVFLHFEQIVQLQIQFEESSCASYQSIRSVG